MNDTDIALERDLFAVLDLLRPRLGRTWEAFAGEPGEEVQVITYDAAAAGFMTDIGIQEFHPVSVVARLFGTHRFEDFEACLQVHRDPKSLNDITDIRWTCWNPPIAQDWAKHLVTSGRMDGLRRFRPEPEVVSAAGAKHCWPWQKQMGLTWTDGLFSTERSRWFRQWVTGAASPDVLRLLGGLHWHDEGEVLVFFRLANASTHSGLIEGPAGEPCMSPTLLLTDAETVVILNWLATISLRLQGVAIHSYADDEGVGHQPLTPELVEGLKEARAVFQRWLGDTYGNRLPLMLDRLTWNADLTFSGLCVGDGDDREPADLLPGQPSIREFL